MGHRRFRDYEFLTLTITIKELTSDTWREAADLRVADHQVGFVAPNMRSIAQSRFMLDWIPTAIYADDTMVGKEEGS
jgi:diamine N-acetyltransferase